MAIDVNIHLCTALTVPKIAFAEDVWSIKRVRESRGESVLTSTTS